MGRKCEPFGPVYSIRITNHILYSSGGEEKSGQSDVGSISASYLEVKQRSRRA